MFRFDSPIAPETAIELKRHRSDSEWNRHHISMYGIVRRAANSDTEIKIMANENYEYEKFLFLLIQLCLSSVVIVAYKRYFCLLMGSLVVCD